MFFNKVNLIYYGKVENFMFKKSRLTEGKDWNHILTDDDWEKIEIISNNFYSGDPGDTKRYTAWVNSIQNALAKELKISLADAKDIMINVLGWDEDNFTCVRYDKSGKNWNDILTDDDFEKLEIISNDFYSGDPGDVKRYTAWINSIQSAIARELKVSLDDAKEIMIDVLGWTENDFINENYNESCLRNKKKSIQKLHIKENTELTKQDITGWAVCYRNMNNGYQYLVCFDDVFDARSCESDFYTIEDFDSDDEDFWDIFNRQRLSSTALYDEIDWRRKIELVDYN